MWIPRSQAFTRLFFLGSANTGLTVGYQLSKNGGAFANSNSGATTLTEIGDGWYSFGLDNIDTGALGVIYHKLTGVTLDNDAQLCDDVVINESGRLGVDVFSIANNVIGSTTFVDGALAPAKFAGGFIEAGSFTAGALDVLAQGRQLPESYAANGVAPTNGQALMMILALLQNIGIVGTTLTVYKLDGTTPAMTFALNSSSNPTARTRAT